MTNGMRCLRCAGHPFARGLCRKHYDAERRGGSGASWGELTCPDCGKTVAKRNGRQLYCSESCRKRAEGRRLRAARPRVRGPVVKRAPGRDCLCPVCASSFVTNRARQVNCSKRCYQRARDRAKGFGHRGRARLAGVRYVTVDRGEIFERDGWRCGICRRSVRRDLTYPHPKSATLDHIVPLNLGGDHVPENLQCAHFLCNSRKGDRIDAGAQMLLIA